MTAEDTFLMLKEFFENRPVSQKALSPLKAGVEIGVVVVNVQGALTKNTEGAVQFLAREALAPDVVFSLDALTAQRLALLPSEDLGEWGVHILREVLAGHIKVKFPGSVWNLLTRGYIQILYSGGTQVRSWLSENGFTDIPKLLRKLKK